MKSKKLIELWKYDCEHCKEVRPILEELEKMGFFFERLNAEEPQGHKMARLYAHQIAQNSKKLGYPLGFLYTPTFINPSTKNVLAFENRAPTKEELIDLNKN